MTVQNSQSKIICGKPVSLIEGDAVTACLHDNGVIQINFKNHSQSLSIDPEKGLIECGGTVQQLRTTKARADLAGFFNLASDTYEFGVKWKGDRLDVSETKHNTLIRFGSTLEDGILLSTFDDEQPHLMGVAVISDDEQLACTEIDLNKAA